MIEFAFSSDATFPTAHEQVENLVIWFAEQLPFPGQTVRVTIDAFQAVIGCTSDETFRWVVHSAIERGLLGGKEATNPSVTYHVENATLTLKGWEWYQDFGRHRRSRIAFMAMKFDDPTLDSIVNTHFRPAVAQTGFNLRVLSDKPEAGVIDNRLRVETRRSRLAICDLTHGNQGAYWEAGFAEGIGIPVIYTCEASAMTPKGSSACTSVSA